MRILNGREKNHSHSCKFIKPSTVEKQKTKNMIYFFFIIALKGLGSQIYKLCSIKPEENKI